MKSFEVLLFGLWTLEEDRVELFKLHQDPRRLPPVGAAAHRVPCPPPIGPSDERRPSSRSRRKLLSPRPGKMYSSSLVLLPSPPHIKTSKQEGAE